jgi:hypothetical protein
MKRFASILETVPQPCQIFGTSLRPFCLGHHLLFHRLNLPFADNPSADCEALQFFQAVFTCAYSYEENITGHNLNEWQVSFDKWFRKVKKNKPDMKSGLAVFRNHLQEGYRIPPIWTRQYKNAIHFSSPWETLLKCRLMIAGFTLAEVLNGFLVERWYDYFTLLEIAQAESTDGKNWQPIFYTKKDALAAEEVA